MSFQWVEICISVYISWLEHFFLPNTTITPLHSLTFWGEKCSKISKITTLFLAELELNLRTPVDMILQVATSNWSRIDRHMQWNLFAISDLYEYIPPWRQRMAFHNLSKHPLAHSSFYKKDKVIFLFLIPIYYYL